MNKCAEHHLLPNSFHLLSDFSAQLPQKKAANPHAWQPAMEYMSKWPQLILSHYLQIAVSIIVTERDHLAVKQTNNTQCLYTERWCRVLAAAYGVIFTLCSDLWNEKYSMSDIAKGWPQRDTRLLSSCIIHNCGFVNSPWARSFPSEVNPTEREGSQTWILPPLRSHSQTPLLAAHTFTEGFACQDK